MEVHTKVADFVAFPASPKAIMTEGADNYNGLTRREYFAARAMVGILASGSIATPEQLAIDAVNYANAMLDLLSRYEGY